MGTDAVARRWPAEGLVRVPYWVYSDRDIHDAEQERIFRGATWNFLCLEAELPGPQHYRRSSLGDMPVVVTRDQRRRRCTPSRTAARTAARCSCSTSSGDAQQHRLRLSQLEL